MELKVKFRKLHPDAVIPLKKYSDDYCYDCVATSCEEIAPNVYKYGLGFALQVDKNDRAIKIPADKLISFDIRPRSSIYKTGMALSNAVGTVDEQYTGEISAVFYHVFSEMPKYQVGDRICQLKIGFSLPLDFVVTDEFYQTERADGAYGSTGI